MPCSIWNVMFLGFKISYLSFRLLFFFLLLVSQRCHLSCTDFAFLNDNDVLQVTYLVRGVNFGHTIIQDGQDYLKSNFNHFLLTRDISSEGEKWELFFLHDWNLFFSQSHLLPSLLFPISKCERYVNNWSFFFNNWRFLKSFRKQKLYKYGCVVTLF